MQFLQLYLSVMVLIEFTEIVTTTLIGKFNGTLGDVRQLEMSMEFIAPSNTVLMWAVDSDGNLFIIKTGIQYQQNKQIECIINKNRFNITSSSIQLGKQNFQKLQWSTEIFHKEFGHSPVFESSMRNIHLNKESRKVINKKMKSNLTLILIGSEVAHKSPISNRKPLFGCLSKFSINGMQIIFDRNGNDFAQNCMKFIKEIILQMNRYAPRNFSLHFLDCGVTSLNTNELCYRDYVVHSHEIHFYELLDGKDQKIIKLIWKPIFSLNECLIEIQTINNSFFLIYKNHKNEIWRSLNGKAWIIHKILSETRYVLLINFQSRNINLQIANESVSYNFNENINIFPKYIHVGFSSQKTLCENLTGEYAIQFENNSFRKFVNFRKRNFPMHYIFLIIMIMIATSCILGIFSQIFSFYRQIPDSPGMRLKNQNMNRRPILSERKNKHSELIYDYEN